MTAPSARSATTDGTAVVGAAAGVGAGVADGRVPTSLTGGVATAELAGAPVDLGGAIGHLRLPSADPTHAHAVVRDRVAPGRPSSGGNQSGGATEVFPFPRPVAAGSARRPRRCAAVRC
jgi:hypothetical protein